MKLPKLNLRSALKRKQSKTGNPIQYDPVLVELMEWIDMITTYEVFNQWRNQFLDRFQDYLGETGSENAVESYSSFRTKVDKLVQSVAKVAHQINEGKISRKKVSVKSRNALNEVSRGCQIINIELFGLAPATAGEEKLVGYNKYHMAGVLIRDGFQEYERLNMCKDILQTLRDRALDEMADRQVLQSIDDYDRSINRFYSLMQELGLHRIMIKAQEVDPIKVPEEITNEMEGEELKIDLASHERHNYGGRKVSGPPPKSQSMPTRTNHPEGRKANRPRNVKLSATSTAQGSIEKARGVENPKSKRNTKEIRKVGPKQSLRQLDRQDSNDSLYLEDEDQPSSQFCRPKSVRKLPAASESPSQERVSRRSLTPPNSRNGIPHSPGDQAEEDNQGGQKYQSDESAIDRKPINGKSPGRKAPGKLAQKSIFTDSDDAAPMVNSEMSPQKKRIATDETITPTVGLLRMEPKKQRSLKNNGWKERGDDDDDNRSVVSISSKKKAKLKAVQARKGKQDLRKGLRGKKEILRKQRNKADRASRVSLTSIGESSNEDAQDVSAALSSKYNKSREHPGSQFPRFNAEDDTKKKTIMKTKVPKSKNLNSVADFFSQTKKSVSQKGDGDAERSFESGNSGKESTKSEPGSSPRKKMNAGKPAAPNHSSSGSKLKDGNRISKKPASRMKSDPPSNKNKRRTGFNTGGYQAGVNQYSNLMLANPTKQKQVVPIENEAGNASRDVQGQKVADTQQPRTSFQWPPSRPNNVDDSASRLTNKWTPPMPTEPDKFKILKEKATTFAEDQERRRSTKSEKSPSRKVTPVKPKRWPSSLLDKSIGMDDTENEHDEELALDALLEDKGEMEDFSFATLHKSFTELQNGFTSKSDKPLRTVRKSESMPFTLSPESSASPSPRVLDQTINKKPPALRALQEENTPTEDAAEADDFSFATLHKNFLKSPSKSPRKVGKLDPLSYTLSPQGSTNSSKSMLDEKNWQSSIRTLEEKAEGGEIGPGADVGMEEEKSFNVVRRSFATGRSSTSQTMRSPQPVGKLRMSPFEVSPMNSPLTQSKKTFQSGKNEQISRFPMPTDDGEDYLISPGRSPVFGRNYAEESAELNVLGERIDEFVTIPVDGDDGEDFSFEAIRKAFSRRNTTQKEESTLAMSGKDSFSARGTLESSTGISSPRPFNPHEVAPAICVGNGSSTIAAKAVELSPRPTQSSPIFKVSNTASTENGATLSPAFRLVSPKVKSPKPKPTSLSPTPKRSTRSPPPARAATKEIDNTTVLPAFKRPASRTLARKPGSPSYAGGKSRARSPGTLKEKVPSRTVSPAIHEEDVKPPSITSLVDSSEDTLKAKSMQLADLINDDDDDEGLFLDDCTHYSGTDTGIKFKPISSWASPAEQEGRDGPLSKRSNNSHGGTSKKSKAPVASIRKVGKGGKVDRMKPQQYHADDDSIVKIRKGGRKKGEMAYDKTAGKRKKKLPEKKKQKEAEGLSGWLNPFDAGSGEHHYEIGTC